MISSVALAETMLQAEALFIEMFGKLTLDQLAPGSSEPLSRHCGAQN